MKIFISLILFLLKSNFFKLIKLSPAKTLILFIFPLDIFNSIKDLKFIFEKILMSLIGHFIIINFSKWETLIFDKKFIEVNKLEDILISFKSLNLNLNILLIIISSILSFFIFIVVFSLFINILYFSFISFIFCICSISLYLFILSITLFIFSL